MPEKVVKYRVNSRLFDTEQEALEFERMSEIPKPLPDPDFAMVERLCREQLIKYRQDGYCCEVDESNRNIAEAAIEALYGKKIWEWIRYQERLGGTANDSDGN